MASVEDGVLVLPQVNGVALWAIIEYLYTGATATGERPCALFMLPVAVMDPSFAHQYNAVITTPMDFGTITVRLFKGDHYR